MERSIFPNNNMCDYIFSENPLGWLKCNVYDNAEVLSTLFALIAFGLKPKQPRFLKPVIIYLFIALPLYVAGNLISDHEELLPSWFPKENNPLYNIHSLIRFFCFAWFFKLLNQPNYKKIRIILPVVSILFLIINFGILKVNFWYRDSINNRLLTVEAFLLLIYCMLYYLSMLKEEDEILPKRKDFWVVTGLSFYVVINFFVFLFYDNLSRPMQAKIWDVHNAAQIIFCLLIAKAFYVPVGNR